MIAASVSAGSTVETVIVFTPPPAMLKVIVSAPAAPFAAMIASRSDVTPSSGFTTSLAVVTMKGDAPPPAASSVTLFALYCVVNPAGVVANVPMTPLPTTGN